jgi:hypothetical protein
MAKLNISLLKEEIQHIKDLFVSAALDGHIQDVTFIGNASEVYEWEPTPIVDLDVCLFVLQRDRVVGDWLISLQRLLTERMKTRGIDFDLRLVRGHYKQVPLHIERSIIVAHMSLFTEEMYLGRPELLRWAWRKYSGFMEPGRLSRMAPERPTFHELLNGRSGVMQKLQSVESGSAPFLEYKLPDFTEIRWMARMGEPLFAEYCLSAGATCARNHARILGREQADYLGNHDFAAWYDSNVLSSAALRALMDLKDKARKEGYGEALVPAPLLAQAYLRELYECIAKTTS